MKKLFLLVPLVFALGCPPPHVDPPPAPGASDCAAAEKRLQVLACTDMRGRPIGGPTLRGRPWGDVCRENINNGVDMKSGCIAQAASCEVVTSCR